MWCAAVLFLLLMPTTHWAFRPSAWDSSDFMWMEGTGALYSPTGLQKSTRGWKLLQLDVVPGGTNQRPGTNVRKADYLNSGHLSLGAYGSRHWYHSVQRPALTSRCSFQTITDFDRQQAVGLNAGTMVPRCNKKNLKNLASCHLIAIIFWGVPKCSKTSCTIAPTPAKFFIFFFAITCKIRKLLCLHLQT